MVPAGRHWRTDARRPARPAAPAACHCCQIDASGCFQALHAFLASPNSPPTVPCSITRTVLGPHKTVVILIPLIYFATSLVVDYVLYWIRGFDAFTDQARGADRAWELETYLGRPELACWHIHCRARRDGCGVHASRRRRVLRLWRQIAAPEPAMRCAGSLPRCSLAPACCALYCCTAWPRCTAGHLLRRGGQPSRGACHRAFPGPHPLCRPRTMQRCLRMRQPRSAGPPASCESRPPARRCCLGSGASRGILCAGLLPWAPGAVPLLPHMPRLAAQLCTQPSPSAATSSACWAIPWSCFLPGSSYS